MQAATFLTHGELVRSRQVGHGMPGDLFSRADVFANDVDVFFYRHWILVGVTSDVPEPGDVSVVDVGKASILMVRDDDNNVRCFRNVCRHRGARLKEAGKSTVGLLVCPYHQWTYDLEGSLRHAPHMGPDFDRSCRSLSSVHTRAIAGLVFVCLADEAPVDIDLLEQTMVPRLAPFRLERTRVAYETQIEEAGNWKLVIDNNRECYHCSATHPELTVTMAAEDFGYSWEELTEDSRRAVDDYKAQYAARLASWQADGLPCGTIDEMTEDRATIFRTQRLMIAGSGVSQTMSTRAACDRPLGDVVRPDQGSMHLWTHNAWCHVMSDHAVISYIIPIGPQLTLLRTKWLVHEDAVENVNYKIDDLTRVWQATNQQDAALVAVTQLGTQDPGYIPGPFSPFTETYVEGFARWYTARLKAHGF